MKTKMDVTKEYSQYERLLASSDFDQTAIPDDLNRSQDLNRLGWCKVHGGMFYPKGHADRQRLVSVGLCETCDFWMEKWRMRNDPKVARIDGKHYIIGNMLEDYEVDANDTLQEVADRFAKDNAAKGMGSDGQVSIIQFYDGRIAITNDLWGQGEIPSEWQATWLYDNAEFVK